MHQLVTDIVAGGVGREEAVRRLDEITRSSKPFPRWMVTVAFGVFSAVFVGVLGGGPGASAVAFVSNLLVSLLARQLGRWRTPDFFITASCSFLVTFIALLLWRFGGLVGIQIAPEIVVVGGILLLLPTGRLVSSVQDAINGFPVTAAGRFLSTHADLRRARRRHRRRLRGGGHDRHGADRRHQNIPAGVSACGWWSS